MCDVAATMMKGRDRRVELRVPVRSSARGRSAQFAYLIEHPYDTVLAIVTGLPDIDSSSAART
jgi:hypothetical protein